MIVANFKYFFSNKCLEWLYTDILWLNSQPPVPLLLVTADVTTIRWSTETDICLNIIETCSQSVLALLQDNETDVAFPLVCPDVCYLTSEALAVATCHNPCVAVSNWSIVLYSVNCSSFCREHSGGASSSLLCKFTTITSHSTKEVGAVM